MYFSAILNIFTPDAEF